MIITNANHMHALHAVWTAPHGTPVVITKNGQPVGVGFRASDEALQHPVKTSEEMHAFGRPHSIALKGVDQIADIITKVGSAAKARYPDRGPQISSACDCVAVVTSTIHLHDAIERGDAVEMLGYGMEIAGNVTDIINRITANSASNILPGVAFFLRLGGDIVLAVCE